MSTLSLSPTTTRKVLAAVVAFLLVSLAIIRTSDAAFTAETSNDGNQFATGEISLETNLASPLFGEEGVAEVPALGLAAGQAIEGCIEITYAGSYVDDDLANVQLAFSEGNDDGLAEHLTVDVDLVDDCTDRDVQNAVATDPLADLLDDTFDSQWIPQTQNETRGFLFTVTVADDNDIQDRSVDNVDLTWSIETDISS